MLNLNQNIFVSLLRLLKVNHTKEFSNTYFNEHPHRNNLFGLSSMLSDYGIDNTALRINEDEKSHALTLLEPPFIAYIGNDFGLIHKITEKDIYYLWGKKEITIPKETFISSWSGIILAAEANENSVEPEYKEHHKKEMMLQGKKTALWGILVLLLGLVAFTGGIYQNPALSVGLVLNCVGIWISYLLLLKQMHIQSNYADKICSLFLHQGHCNDLLESDAQKVAGQNKNK